jgi:hypothetical protein
VVDAPAPEIARAAEESISALQAQAAQLERWIETLGRRERELIAREERAAVERDVLEAQLEELEERTRSLEQREARFATRWSWLLRAWSWRPPLPGRRAQLCDLLLVPSGEGYKLLEQEGVALRDGSRLTGLLGDERTFLVTRIAQLPFDGRWCAYLQQEPPHTTKGLA